MPIGAWTVISTVPGVAIKTFFRHYLQYAKQVKESECRSELTYDEAFWVIKAFLEKATTYTIEDVQSFCNTHVPSPPWITVVPVVIPAETCVVAARVIVEHLGEEECERVAGGQTWWQRRARADGGVEAEWISMRRDWTGEDIREGKPDKKGKAKMLAKEAKQSKAERKLPPQYTPDMDESPRTMLYIHGGAHYVCSLNTHRYAIWRYARKMGGRAFGVTYRLSPQYPWPCALQDCLAAYLYLIRPPPEAKHQPVDPRRIVFAGDSAGGGLALALMCLIRDMRLPAPACGVLISPWVDLTHSFPSILQNTATDIIMTYGFIHKPSALWPPPDSEARSKMDKEFSQFERDGMSARVQEEMAKLKQRHHKGNHAKHGSQDGSPIYRSNRNSGASTPLEALTVQDGGVKELKSSTEQPSQPETSGKEGAELQAKQKDKGKHPNEDVDGKPAKQGKSAEEVNEGDRAEPGPVTRITVDGKLVELREQIQLYATNAQLTHPLVSPALQASLGGLPPLLVIAGDKEVLRDEIIYIAHRAAHPDRYPLRKELLDQQKKGAKLAAHYKPTEVHLQVYDGACHVIPMFSFTSPAKYAFRSIASFCVANTMAPTIGEPLQMQDSPTDNGQPIADKTAPIAHGRRASTSAAAATTAERHYAERAGNMEQEPQDKPDLTIQTDANEETSGPLQKSRSYGPNRKFTRYFTMSPTDSPSSIASGFTDPRTRTIKKRDLKRLDQTIYTETRPDHRPKYKDHMIRERVATNGTIRPLEDESKIAALQLKPDDIGLVKEGPVKRYLEGKALWDKRYAKTYEKIKRERARHIREAQRDEISRLRKQLKKLGDNSEEMEDTETDSNAKLRSLWDLGNEKPPPSSIAARQDVAEALRLARVVDDQRESLTHPIALWNNLHDVSWLRADGKEDSDEESEPKDTGEDAKHEKDNGISAL